MKHFDRSFRLVLFACALICLYKFCNHQTDGFRVARIQSNHPYNSDWEVDNPPLANLEKIFNQRFTYLGAGGQCFAFASEDGNYVLKFFKHHLRRLPLWRKALPLPRYWSMKREATRCKLAQKLSRDFTSYKIAIEQLQEDSGLLMVHLNPTSSLQHSARVVDKLGIEHRIDLDQVDFVLQRRVTMAYPHLLHLVEINDLAGAKESIDSLCSLILDRCKKGIHDEDARIHCNFGFLGNKAILVDGGRLKIDPTRQDPAVQQKDLIQITSKLKTFLEGISPPLADYLQERTND